MPRLTLEEKVAVRKLILGQVEYPVFDNDYQPGVAWTPEEFDRIILGNPETVIVLAVAGHIGGAKLIGYASGIPAISEEFTQEELTTPEDPPRILPLPREDTFEFDTIGVLPAYRRQGVATILFEHRKRLAFANPKWQSLSVVLLAGAWSRNLLEKDPDIGLDLLRRHGKVVEGPVVFRGNPADYVFADFSEPVEGVPITSSSYRF